MHITITANKKKKKKKDKAEEKKFKRDDEAHFPPAKQVRQRQKTAQQNLNMTLAPRYSLNKLLFD